MSELIFLAFLAVVGGLGLREVITYTVAAYDRTGGPAIYPKLILILLMVALAVRVIQILLTKDKDKFKWNTLFKGPRGVFFAAFVAFVILMDLLGFIVDGTLFLIFTSLYLYYATTGDKTLGGKKLIIKRCVISLVFCVAVYAFFSEFLHVMVPKGILSFML